MTRISDAIKEDLLRFEKKVADAFEAGQIKGPIHLSGGNEDQLIEIFKGIKPKYTSWHTGDWVFSTWRSHYHALLHGVPEEKVMSEIMAGRSMGLMFPEHNFFTSAIVGGICPIAVGVAKGLKMQGSDSNVWCFVGDMAATTGIFNESVNYAYKHNLPIKFIIEDNNLSCNTPTQEIMTSNCNVNWPYRQYEYKRTVPHCGTGKWVTF